MRLQDLSVEEKAWFMGLTLPWGHLHGKVTMDMQTGDLKWSDEEARKWFEGELAKRRGQSQPPRGPAPPRQDDQAKAELDRRLQEIEASPILTPAEKTDMRKRILDDFYGVG